MGENRKVKRNMKTYQKILLVIGTVAAIFFILKGIPMLSEMVKAATGYDFSIFMYLGVVLILFIIGRVSGGGEYNKLNKQLRELDRELLNNHRFDYYIAQQKRLYKETKDEKYRGIIMTNIATAYRHDGKYDRSNNTIEKIKLSALSEEQQVTVFNMQFLNYMNMNQLDTAKVVFDAHKELFDKYEKNKEYHNHYLLSRLNYELATAAKDPEKIAKIRQEFDTIKIPDKAYQKAVSYRLFLGKLLIAEGRGKEGKDNLRNLQKDFLMPGVKREIARTLHS